MFAQHVSDRGGDKESQTKKGSLLSVFGNASFLGRLLANRPCFLAFSDTLTNSVMTIIKLTSYFFWNVAKETIIGHGLGENDLGSQIDRA